MRRICARFPPSSDVSNIWLITFLITFAFWKKEKALKQRFWCATRQVDKLNNENFFFPGTVYVPGCLCNAF